MEQIRKVLKQSTYLKLFIFVSTFAFVTWLLANTLPPAFDFRNYWFLGTRDWLDGGLIHSDWLDFPYTPWILFFSIPFALPPEPVGRALLFIFAVLVMSVMSRSVSNRKLTQALVVLSLPAMVIYWVGALEPYSILGIGLCVIAINKRKPWMFSIGFPLLFVRPQETVLTGLLLIWSIRKWRKDELIQAAVGPAIALLAALLFFDFQWLERLVQLPQDEFYAWMNISLWWRFGPYWLAVLLSIVTALLGIWLSFRIRFSSYSIALITVFGAVSSPFLHTHHLIVPMVFAWPYLFDRKPLFGFIAYSTTILALFRLGGDQGWNWLDFIFPLSMAILLLVFYRENLVDSSKETP